LRKRHLFSFLLCFIGGVSFASDDSPVQTVLQPFQETTIASRVDSVLVRSHFKVGEKFRKGDILLELDSQKFVIMMERTAAKKTFAEQDLEDKKDLFSKSLSSNWELKKAEFEYKIAKADNDEAVLNYSCCEIRAPFDGKIAEMMTHEHETVRNGQPLCRIIADDKLLAVMNVPINEKALRTPGSSATIRLNDSHLVKGTVYEVAPISDNHTGTVRIRVLIPNDSGTYFVGLTGVLQNAAK